MRSAVFGSTRKRADSKRQTGKLLAATWNIANLGPRAARPGSLLIAEVIGWFDIVAVQECRRTSVTCSMSTRSFQVFQVSCPMRQETTSGWRSFTTEELGLLEEVGEIAFPPSRFKSIKLPQSTPFNGFDRTPYLAAFSVAIVHDVRECSPVLRGRKVRIDCSSVTGDICRGQMGDLRNKSPYSFTRNWSPWGISTCPNARQAIRSTQP